jgi:hypothetical protein
MTRSDVSEPELLVVKARSLPALSESATAELLAEVRVQGDRKSTRLNSSHW